MRAVVFVFICCALTALSWTQGAKESKPPATVSPALQFETGTAPNATTPTPAPNATTPAPNATTPAPNATTTTTTLAPNATTTTTTLAPNATTTTTTLAPNATTTTTTLAPNATTTTTTLAPNATTTTTTPAPNATTTTPAPNTTTTTTPTTTPKRTTTPPVTPTPATELKEGNYTLNYPDKTAFCVMAVMALQIRLQSPEANGTFIIQKNKTTTEGSCTESAANLTIAFKEGFITFLFNKSVANNTAYVDGLIFKLSYPFGKGGNGEYHADNKSVHLFAAKIGHCYSCKSDSLYMGRGLYLDVTQDRMQAFNLTKNDFGVSDHCAADRSGYGAAIAVGITLLVLIVIVVIVYLLGRRRRADGYQSL